MRTHLLRLQVIVGEAEAFGDVIGNVTEVVGVVDLVPGFLHSTAVFLGRAAGTWITAEEEGLDGSLEFVDFGLRGKVLRIVRDQFRAEAWSVSCLILYEYCTAPLRISTISPTFNILEGLAFTPPILTLPPLQASVASVRVLNTLMAQRTLSILSVSAIT